MLRGRARGRRYKYHEEIVLSDGGLEGLCSGEGAAERRFYKGSPGVTGGLASRSCTGGWDVSGLNGEGLAYTGGNGSEKAHTCW